MIDNAIIFEPEQEIIISGVATECPDSLYIPPDALRVVLENFSGPLDLLLYLIRQQNIDILNIPIYQITKQYMLYVELMKSQNLELAAEYLLMAAILAEIKSRMLLPRQISDDEDEDEDMDPRAELIKRLQEYERFKLAANDLDQLPRMHRDNFVSLSFVQLPETQTKASVTLDELLLAFAELNQHAKLFNQHQISREPLSVRERMSIILTNIQLKKTSSFTQLFTLEEGQAGAIVTFLAILELIKEQLIEIVQNQNYSEIYLQAKIS